MKAFFVRIQEIGNLAVKIEIMPLVIDFHPAFSGLSKIIDLAWPVLHTLESMRKVFREKPLVAFTRPRNLKDVMVRSKVKSERIIWIRV